MRFPEKLYVGGELVESGARVAVENPASEELVAGVCAAGMEEAQRALECARDAFPAWAATPIGERQAWMRRLREEVIANEEWLRLCIHHELGKAWASTQEDFDALKNSLAFYAEEIARVGGYALADRAGTHAHRMVYEPAGVAVAFLAWNFPLLNLAFKLGPAMASGCPILIRPSSETPLSAYAVGELCHNIGLPAGVVQIFATDGHETADALSASPIPALLTLIGSTATGRRIMRVGASSIKKYSMELGGNAPVLVFDDADVGQAAEVVCGVKFSNAGQICVAPNRVYVQRGVLDEFAAAAVSHARSAKVGWDRHADIDTGPLANGKAWERVAGLVERAVSAGAELLAGGGRPAEMRKGHYFAPTVLVGVREDMEIYREEIFAPVVSVIPFDGEESLLEKANDCGEGGLTAYIFTRDLRKAEQYAAGLRYGEVQINGVKYDIDLPHGGIGQSGVGHDCSRLALFDYLVAKRISRALEGGRQ